MKLLASELSKINEQTGKLIENDDFPEKIQPEILREAVLAYPRRGGKRLRPALLMWCCGLCGGNPEKALYPAAAVEIYHNWTLVHDDIIDNDNVRRGEPTTHISLADTAANELGLKDGPANRLGRDLAILCGDLQQAWAVNMILKADLPPELILALSKRLQEHVGRDLISGEALDVEFAYLNRNKLGWNDIETMLRGKTGALLKYCAEAGAAIALNDPDFTSEQVRKLGDMAEAAGIAFQLRDDWLGVFGDESEFGKPVCSDLSENKPTLLLIGALSGLLNPEKAELENLLGRPEYTEQEIRRMQFLIKSSGAETQILDYAEKLSKKAKNLLAEFPENHYRQLLEEFLDFLLTRNY